MFDHYRKIIYLKYFEIFLKQSHFSKMFSKKNWTVGHKREKPPVLDRESECWSPFIWLSLHGLFALHSLINLSELAFSSA